MDCFPRYSSLNLKEWAFRVCNTSFYDVLALNMSVEESEVILMVLSLQVTQSFYIGLVNTLLFVCGFSVVEICPVEFLFLYMWYCVGL